MTALFLSIVSMGQNKQLKIDIRGRDCDGGTGLCSIFISTSVSNTSNMKNYNVIKLSSKSIIIEIQTANLSIEDQKLFFGKEYSNINADESLVFLQDKDFVFDINTILYLELDPGYRLLKRGSYPLEIVNGKVQVTLSLLPYL